MDPTNIGIFNLADKRLAWVDRRQQLLAQNVANANTPGYQPRDVTPFEAALAAPKLAETSAGHIAGKGQAAGEVTPRPQARSPNGNAVSIEQQLSAVADTAGIQSLALNLHQAYASMMRTAFGRVG